MEAGADACERQLVLDLATCEERFSDDDFCGQLYRGLASTVWLKEGIEGELGLSWSRAEEVVNDLRARVSQDPLVLAQTGGEGEISGAVAEEMGNLGWTPRPLDTQSNEPSHVSG